MKMLVLGKLIGDLHSFKVDQADNNLLSKSLGISRAFTPV